MDTFSPREVQARVRAGESAEDVATDTGWDLDKVLRYAEPLLAERTFMANQAQTVEVRRSRGSVSLYEAAEQVLGAPAMDEVRWDAFRREDGRWVVTASLDGETAEWTYDHHGRNLHPLNESARRLMGATPAPVEQEVDIAAALDLATEVPIVREESDARPHLAVVPSQGDDAAGTDEPEVAPTAKKPGDEPVDEPVVRAGGGYEQETISLPRGQEPEAPEASRDDQQPAKRGARKAKGRKGRTSVPSWDEILFGAGRSDD